MKKRELVEEKNKELKELKKDLGEKVASLRKIRLELTSGKIKNTRVVKNLRKDIAQIQTIISEKSEEA